MISKKAIRARVKNRMARRRKKLKGNEATSRWKAPYAEQWGIKCSITDPPFRVREPGAGVPGMNVPPKYDVPAPSGVGGNTLTNIMRWFD